jgi:pimeloyl-ACP methyl ester carboxylesterase
MLISSGMSRHGYRKGARICCRTISKRTLLVVSERSASDSSLVWRAFSLLFPLDLDIISTAMFATPPRTNRLRGDCVAGEVEMSQGAIFKRVSAGVLDIAYYESGPANGVPTILLHGFPYDAHAYDEAVPFLTAAGHRCIVPFLRGYGPTRFLSQETPRSGEQAALGADLLELMDSLDIEKAILGGYDWGGRAACIVAALWPGRVVGLVNAGMGYNIQDIACAATPAAPDQEARDWYQYYFHTDRGRKGLAEKPGEISRFLWKTWSPSWPFDEEIFAQTAVSFDNPDFADVVIHSYRHRYDAIAGDPAYVEIEARLARQPDISVPTIVLLGADDGVDPPPLKDEDAKKFTGFYERRILPGVGHNVPQEAPSIFAQSVRELRERA